VSLSDILRSGPPPPPAPPGFARNDGGGNQVTQSLSHNFGGFMQGLPGRLLSTIFPNSSAGTPANTSPGGQAPASGSSVPAGSPPVVTSNGFPTPPPPPGFAPPGSASAQNATAGMQTGGGLMGTAGNVLNSATDLVRSLLTPPTQPNAAAAMPGTPGSAAGAASTPSNLVNTAADVVRTVATTLSGVPQTAAQTTPQTSAAQPQPAGPMQSAQTQALPGQQSTMQALAQAPQPQTTAQTAQQGANTLAQPSTAVPVPLQAQPGRADAAFAPPGNTAADRAALPQQAQAPMQPGVPSAPQGATLVAAVPLATTVAQAPVAQQLAGNPQAQATGNPLAGTAALDAGSPARAELTGTGTYTAEGPGLRRRERMKVGARQMGQWMLAAAQGRLHLVRPHDDSRHEAERVFQWLFWVLAIVAYGSLGLVLVAFLLSFGELPAAPTLRRWTGEFAFAGLLAAVGAWWLGRQLTRAARPPPDPIRR